MFQHIHATAPYWEHHARTALHPSAAILKRLRTRDTHEPLEYFQLCVSAHHLTCGSFVPTDVDNSIRFKLWHPKLGEETLLALAQFVSETSSWDSTPVSNRVLVSGREKLSGHHGEWLTTAVPAYAVSRGRAPVLALEWRDRIRGEVVREVSVFLERYLARDGIGVLKAATIIAHNLGDLDRAIDLWSLPPGDPLRTAVYKLGHEDGTASGWSTGERTLLCSAGALNKAFMATENHRHFALRKPKALRQSPDRLLPIAPFFYEWGAGLAQELRDGRTASGDSALAMSELAEVIEALVDGYFWLRKQDPTLQPVSYPRAIAGIVSHFPGGMNALLPELSSKLGRDLKSGELRSAVAAGQPGFMGRMNTLALNFLDPSLRKIKKAGLSGSA